MCAPALAFDDVPPDAWYKATVTNFVEEGFIDDDRVFRPSSAALREEFIVILIRMLGGISMNIDELPPFFTDVFPEDGFFLDFQKAAQSGLVRGAENCVGTLPCEAHPYDSINRAEAAILLTRAFDLVGASEAPEFDDVDSDAWYAQSIRVAASRCILHGDAGKHTVRPSDRMNRAEMMVMIDRARRALHYGIDCNEQSPAPATNVGPDRPPRHPEDETPEPRAFELPPSQIPTGVPLLRFDMSAHTVRDIVLTGLTVDAAQGSLFNAKNYGLWVDHDGDGEVETPLMLAAAPKGSVVAFDSLFGGGYVVTEQSVTFEVRATISASPTSSILQLKIADNGIEAEELDGRALSGIRKDGICVGRCQINQQTTPAEILTILPQGNLFITESTVPIRSHLLLGGSVTEPILQLTFRADNEPIDVTELRITSSGSLANSIERLELLRWNSSSFFAEATISACGGDDLLTQNPADGSTLRTFCTSLPTGTLRIPEDIRTDLFIRARMKSDNTGGTSGEKIQLWLTEQAVSADQSGSGSIKARGVSSSSRIAANDGDSSAEGELFIGTDQAGANRRIIGTLHTSILSTINAIENGSSDFEGTTISSGERTIGALRFRTATNNNSHSGSNEIVLDDLLFTVNATNVTLDASLFSLLNSADPITTHNCSALDSSGGALNGVITGSFFVSCAGLHAAAIATSIDSNSAITLMLKGTIINPQVSSSSHSFLQLSLQNFTTPRSNFGVSGSHIHYLDYDAGGSEDFYWIDLPNAEITSTEYEL